MDVWKLSYTNGLTRSAIESLILPYQTLSFVFLVPRKKRNENIYFFDR
jgi:hypothetical protein